jgi:VCBS repeat-containing protein
LNVDGTYSYAVNNANTSVQALRASAQTLTENFTYTVRDTAGDTDTATLTITIRGANDAPVLTVGGGSGITEDLWSTVTGRGEASFAGVDLGNATYSELYKSDAQWTAGALSAVQESAITSGFRLSEAGWTYNVANTDLGFLADGETITFSFDVTADDGGVSDTKTVTLKLVGTGTLPQLEVMPGTGVDGSQVLTDRGALSFTDVDAGETVTISSSFSGSVWSGGTLTAAQESALKGVFSADQFGWDYSVNTAALQFLGAGETVALKYSVQATDLAGAKDIKTVTVLLTGVNDAPVAVADTGTALEAGGVANAAAGLPATGNVLTDDTDVDATDTKTVTSVAGGSVGGALTGNHGTLTLNGDGSYSYVVHEEDAAVEELRTSADTLSESFTYTVQDAAGAASSAMLTITIHGSNDAPAATGTYTHTVTDTAATDTFGALTGTLTATDRDTGDTLTWSGSGVGTYGSLTVNADGSYSYAVNAVAVNALQAAQNPTDSFTVTVTDAGGLTDTRTIRINIVGADEAPVIVAPEHAVPTVVSLTTDIGTPTLTGSVSVLHAGEALTISVNGHDYVPVITGSTWTIAIPEEQALADGTYEIDAIVADSTGYAGKALGTVTVARPTVPVLPPTPAPVPDPIPVSGTPPSPGAPLPPTVDPTPTTPPVRAVDPILATQPVNLSGGLGGAPAGAVGADAGAGQPGAAPGTDINALPAPAAGTPAPAAPPPVAPVDQGFQVSRITQSETPVRAAELASITAGRLFVLEGVPDVQADKQFQVPAEAFAHTDAGAVIKLEARLSNGDPLPAWLKFNNANGTFTGAPPDGKPTPVEVQVVARDNQAREASVIFKLELGVTGTANAGQGTAALDSTDHGFPVSRVGIDASAAAQAGAGEAQAATGNRLFVLEGVKNAVGDQNYQLPQEAFAHTDANAVVKLEARQANGEPLPSWIQFDPASGLFRGTPPDGKPTALDVVVTARDNEAREASVVFKLELGVPSTASPTASPSGAPADVGVTKPDAPASTDKSTGNTAPAQPGARLGIDAGGALKLSQQDLAGLQAAALGTLGATDRGFPVARVPADSLVRVSGADGQALAEQRLFVFQGVLAARGDSQFQVPSNAFGHTDPSAMVMLEAHTADGSVLPSWLQFDARTGIFSGMPPGGQRTTIEIILTARDEEGREANLSFTLELGIKDGETEPAKADSARPPAEPRANRDADDADADSDETGEVGVADAGDGTVGHKVEKAKPVRAGAAPFGEQIRAAKIARDPLLAKILARDKPTGRTVL